MNPNIFRMYDIRGIADQDLTDEVVESVGKAYGTFMTRKKYRQVSVGRDLRLSSERIQKALIRGVLSTGLDVVDVGLLPTPVLYYSIVSLKTDGAVMVTGSHNPIEFNGLKMNEGLLSIFGEDIFHLKELIESGDFETGSGMLTHQEVVSDYKRMLKEKIRLSRTFKIVIDAGNATAGPIAPEIYESLGCEVIRLYCEPDGNFPNHLPDPTVMEYIQDLRKKVIQEKADFGLGYDGDSDRVGVIDEKGRPVYADKILALLSREVLSRKPGSKVIFDVKCSQMLPEVIKKAGGEPLMWMTGHSLIKKKMKEEMAPIAGEMSGHIFFKDGYFGFDDGIYVSLRLAQMLSNLDQTLGELVDELPQFVSTPELRIACPDEEKFEVIQELIKNFKKEYEVIDVDGARVQFGDGWGLVRASNTQPVLVLRFEAKTEKRLNEIRDVFKKKLSTFSMIRILELDG
jgi:phosphomannomutase/phosphoglucomutase